ARARAELAGIEREFETLQRQHTAGGQRRGGPTALSRLRAAPGYERALGAVLGGDGEAPLIRPEPGAAGRYWTGADAPAPLADSLSAHVPVAPPELAARLALVRVADRDDGCRLAPGEWLVTRDGALRRWDGFVVRGEGAREAASLEAANRLAALGEALPPLRQARDGAAAEAETAARSLAETQAALAAAEHDLAARGVAERTALRALDQAETARERQAARREEVTAALADLDARMAQAASELSAAEQRRDALPDPALGRERLSQTRVAHDAARRGLQAALAAVSGLEQALAGRREQRAVLRGDLRNWEARGGDAERRSAAVVLQREELTGERAILAARPEGLRRDLDESATLGERLEQERAAAEAAGHAAETVAGAADRALAAVTEALAAARERRAASAARAEAQDARRGDLARQCGDRFACPPPMLPDRFAFEPGDVGDGPSEAAAMDRLIGERDRLGAVNLVAADELAQAEARHGETAAEQAELSEAVHRLRGSIGNLNREGRERLRAAFSAVDGHFRRLYGRLFEGGSAHLALIDSDDPLEAGLEIFAQPPGKRLQSLTLLSGGEQALTAVALIFALFLTNPAPICVLDEVDAPLDDANVERFCDLLDTMVAETATRFLIVTHNAVTMSRMHRLFGVTMIEQGVSRLVSVDLGAAEALLAAE
ncbi:MAG: chromosome segregation protein, partial [Novosphingobium sp.]